MDKNKFWCIINYKIIEFVYLFTNEGLIWNRIVKRIECPT